jgi:hypothetical protein
MRKETYWSPARLVFDLFAHFTASRSVQLQSRCRTVTLNTSPGIFFYWRKEGNEKIETRFYWSSTYPCGENPLKRRGMGCDSMVSHDVHHRGNDSF